MTSDLIHRILRSLQNSFGSNSPMHAPAVDNHKPSPEPVTQQERRIDARFTVKTPCLYGLAPERRRETPLISGKAHSLNISSEGVLLLLDQKALGGSCSRSTIPLSNHNVRQVCLKCAGQRNYRSDRSSRVTWLAVISPSDVFPSFSSNAGTWTATFQASRCNDLALGACPLEDGSRAEWKLSVGECRQAAERSEG